MSNKALATSLLIFTIAVLGAFHIFATNLGAKANEIATAQITETADRPAQDLIYVAVINGFKVPITITKGSLNPEHRGKIWQTKDQYDAEWERAMKWKEEILEEEKQSNPN